jgi:metal-responsive CopG/Arc/MetJ family transcriptional regulator
MMRFETPKMPAHSKLEIINARLPNGTSDRIDRVLNGGEVRSAFIRHAVEAELQRREESGVMRPARSRPSRAP